MLLESALLGMGEGDFHWGPFLGKVINSLILFGGLFYFLKNPVKEFLTRKSTAVKKDIQRGEEDIHQAKKESQMISLQIKNLQDELKKIMDADLRVAKETVKKIEAQQNNEIDRIRQKYQQDLDERESIILSELKKEVTNKIIEQFAQEIGKEINEDFHHQMIMKNIKVIGKKYENQNH